MARVRIYRSKQLTDKLRALREEVQAPVRQELAASAGDLVAMMKRLVPDGPGKGAYDLGETIRFKFGADEGGGSDPVTGRSAATSVTIMAGDDKNPEARWVEFGTAPHKNEGMYRGTDHPGAPPRPFFFPSYRAMKKQIKNRVNKAIRNAVRSIAAK